MSHEEIRELLAGYAIDSLTDEETAVLASHLASCAECRAELKSLQEAVEAMAEAVPPVAPPERLRAGVLERYRPVCDSIGRRVRVTTTSGASVEGEAVGVSERGDLLVRAGDRVERVGFGEVEHLR